ncbi:MAG: hypothetical protein J6V22_00465, partial [Clostridia bacterium]|nr:hypothetical protein [Clostridia bacterium]
LYLLLISFLSLLLFSLSACNEVQAATLMDKFLYLLMFFGGSISTYAIIALIGRHDKWVKLEQIASMLIVPHVIIFSLFFFV